MTYLVTHFWAWWMSALALGTATAFIVARRPERGPVATWLVWFGLSFFVGLPVAFLHLLSGRAGLWLEIELALFAGFVAGAALGAWAGGRSLRDHEGWAVGLAPLALIWIGAGVLGGRSLESDLTRRAASAVEALDGGPVTLEAKGRDVLLPHGLPNRDAAEQKIAQIPGVRRVVEIDAPAAAAASADAPAPASAETARVTSEEPARPTDIEDGEPPKAQAETRGATAETSAASGELDAAACQKAVAATLADEPIQFTRRGGIRRLSSGALEKVTAFLRRCPVAKVEVRAYGAAGDAHAERVADYLARMGVERGRLVATGMPASSDIHETKRGVEIVVGPRG